MQMISELSDLGNVKSIEISKRHRLLVLASDKNLQIWDLVGLTKIG